MSKQTKYSSHTNQIMSLKFSKASSSSLNPNAKEWRPADQPPQNSTHFFHLQQHYAHLIYSHSPPPPVTTVQAVAFTAAPPPQNLFYAGGQQLAYFYPSFPTYHWATASPPTSYPHSAEHVFPASDDCFYEVLEPFSGGEAVKKLNSAVGKRLKCTFSGFKIKNFNGVGSFPPRMRGAVRSFLVNEKPFPKKVWRQKKTTSVHGGAALAPPVSPANISLTAENTEKTTVMIKNVPNQLRRDFMLNCMDNCCRDYSLEYDFLYLPMDFRSGDNLGYAFVNFTNAVAANKFKTIFQGFKWETLHTERGPISSKKICHITWARVQGKNELLRRFQGSNFICDKLEYLPVLLDPPRNGSDPNPPSPVVVGQLRLCPYTGRS